MRNRKSASPPITTPEQVVAGYQQGYFPMAQGLHGEIEWYIADPRTIIPLDDRFHVRRSLRKKIRQCNYQVTFDKSFSAVIRACARHDEVPEEEVWLSEEMISLYIELHRRNFAHSVEVWNDEELVGGLYGIALKSAFFGESMFSKADSASQIALVSLVERLREHKYSLLDAQMRTTHIGFFGAIDLYHEEYLTLLDKALHIDCRF